LMPAKQSVQSRSWTVEDIAEAVEIPARKVRYVLYHRLVPSLKTKAPGATKRYNGFQAFVISLAARMHDVGVGSPAIRRCMRHYSEIRLLFDHNPCVMEFELGRGLTVELRTKYPERFKE